MNSFSTMSNTNMRILLLLAAVGASSVEGFSPSLRIENLKALKPDHLRYIATEEIVTRESSVVLPISQAIHKRLGQFQKPKQLAPPPPAKRARAAPTASLIVNNRQSSSDWWHNIQTLPDSSVLNEIKNPVITLTVWGTFISIIHKVLLLKGKARLAASFTVPMVAHSLLVSSLGLLLVFKTNSSYQRFMEGRQIWERIHSISRNLSRMTTLYRDDVGSEGLARMKNLIASFPYLLRHHIRSGCLCSTDPASMDEKYKLQLHNAPTSCAIETRYEGDKTSMLELEAAEVQKCFVDRRDVPWNMLDDPQRDTLLKVARSSNRPLWICDRLSLEISKIPYSNSFTSRERLTLLKSVDDLSGTVGQCERIQQTGVPLNYARHALRGLSLWLLTLPFCMVKDLGLMTGPATAIMSWVLFGVYQIGYSIESPFQKSLRLSILCDAIRRDIIGNESDSAFYIEEEEDDFPETIREPHSLKGLNGKDGDFLDEADLNVVFVRPPTPSQQQSLNDVNIDRKQQGQAERAGTVATAVAAEPLMP